MAKERENIHKAYEKLTRDIAAGNIGRLYVFWGEESYLRDHSLASIRGKLIAPGTESFNYRVFSGGASVSVIEEAVDSFPMLADRTMAVIKDVDLFHLPEAEQEKLIRLLEGLPEYCCLVFIYDTIEYSPDKRRKIYSALTKNGEIVEFAGQEQNKLIKWIQKHVHDCGHSISPDNADYLMFLCGSLMNTLLMEIEKLCAYAKGAEITREEMDAVVTPRLEAGAFNLADALIGGRTDRAVGILSQLLLMREAPPAILGAIGWQLRRVYTARLVKKKKKDENALMELWPGMSFYQAKRMLKTSENAGAGWCRRALIACAEADCQLKSGGGDEKEALEILLLKLAKESV